MYGIEKLKDVGTNGVKFAMKLMEALEDGKFSIMEGVDLAIFTVPKVLGYVNDGEQIKNEFLDLDDTEAQELSDHIAEKLDLQNDQVEDLIEYFLDWLVGTRVLVRKVKGVISPDDDQD